MSVELIQEAALTSRNSVLDDLTSDVVPRGADITSQYGGKLRSWAEANAALLHLSSEEAIQPEGFHTVFRVGRDGMLLMELVLQFTQTRGQTQYDFGGVPLRGGSTIIVQANGKIRYVI